MKFNAKTLILVLIFCLSLSGVCFAAESFNAEPFTAFYLDSALGNRSLANQSTVAMKAIQELPTLKSPNEAFLYSLVIPGMGQLYAGAKRGYIYTFAEVGFLATYFWLRNKAVDIRDDYRKVVREHVDFIGPGSFEDWDPIEDFEHATQYENWNHVYDSEETRARTGKWYWDDAKSFKDEADVDIEFDSPRRLEAFGLRQKANDTFQRAKFFLGMAILNHVVSAVEARITTKRFNARVQNALTQTRVNAFEIDIQTNMSAGALTSVLVLRKSF